MKWDGYRALAEIQKESVHLYSRNFQMFDQRFPTLLQELRAIPIEVVLDGEIVILDKQNQLQFLDYPTYLVIDLDPENVIFDAVIEVALT